MNKYVRKYKKIVDRLIKKSFPELRGKRIKIIPSPSGFYAFYVPGNFIGITKKCENLSDKELKGILVHELCHAVQLNEKGFFKSYFIFISYLISPKLKNRIEIEADKLVIKKGYARNLFASTEKIKTEFNKKNIIYYGLTPNQIKSYAKKIGKWQQF